MCFRTDLTDHSMVIADHIRLVSLAQAEYDADGIVSTDTFMSMTNAGLMAEEIIDNLKETPRVN